MPMLKLINPELNSNLNPNPEIAELVRAAPNNFLEKVLVCVAERVSYKQ
jgi:hypothetical protein